jgi:hypothetical protein
MDKLNITNEMAQLDRKQRDFYDSLNDEERKKFSTFLMLRWSSSVQGDAELQEYYVQACNHYLNHDFFAVNRHPKLQWLMATAVSPGLGTPRHTWIAPSKKDKSNKNTKKKTLNVLFPNHKLADIDVLSKLLTEEEINQLEKDHGSRD